MSTLNICGLKIYTSNVLNTCGYAVFKLLVNFNSYNVESQNNHVRSTLLFNFGSDVELHNLTDGLEVYSLSCEVHDCFGFFFAILRHNTYIEANNNIIWMQKKYN